LFIGGNLNIPQQIIDREHISFDFRASLQSSQREGFAKALGDLGKFVARDIEDLLCLTESRLSITDSPTMMRTLLISG
jgi:hypothetical protein